MYKAIEVTKVLKGQKVPHGKNSFEPLNTKCLKVDINGHGHNMRLLY